MQAPTAAPVRPRQRLKRWEVVALIVWTLLIVAFGWEVVVGPTPDMRAGEMRVMRAQMATLPAYRGSHLDYYDADDRFMDATLDVLEGYMFTGRCEDVQQHYQDAATQAGWAVLNPLYVVAGGDSRDEFHTDYQQTVAGYRLFLSVGCSVHPDSTNPPEAGHIYTVDISDVAPAGPTN